jgi:hypothetical protein
MGPSYGAASGFVKLGAGRPALSCGVPLLVLLVLLFPPEAVTAQGLPPYRPINPVATSRSSISFEPFHMPRPGRWAADLGIEYASTIEYNVVPQASFFLDSELMRVRTTVTRDVGARTFLLGEAELLGAYAGVLDGFLEWYHRLLGIDIPERERRPRNEFLYAADLLGRGPVIRQPGDFFLGDLRLGFGVRVHPVVQTVAVMTLPTNTGPEGYGRGVVSASLLNTIRFIPSPKLTFEGSLSAGYTPTHGQLAQWQRETFLAGSAGMRWRFWGRQSLYGNLFLHSPSYRDAGVPSLDNRELSLDFGWILGMAGGRELRLGMTEDLEPGGPAVDLVFRVGARL